MDLREVNVLVLAYLGDTIYEDYIREHLIKSGINNVNDLQKSSIFYVSAKNQAAYLKKLIDDNVFSNEELDVVRRARNNRHGNHPKNCDIVTYKHATALEAVIGYLKLKNDVERITEIINKIIY